MIGVGLYILGGLAGASFYLPLQRVKKWAWESYWMVYAVTALVVVPWLLALSLSPYLFRVLGQAEVQTLVGCFVFGAMWGVGGLTWGLMIRYLGVGLGLAIGAGVLRLGRHYLAADLCRDFHLAPACLLRRRRLYPDRRWYRRGGDRLRGPGRHEQGRELSTEQKTQGVAEYNFPLGLALAVFSGVMSSGMALGIRKGDAIKALHHAN